MNKKVKSSICFKLVAGTVICALLTVICILTLPNVLNHEPSWNKADNTTQEVDASSSVYIPPIKFSESVDPNACMVSLVSWNGRVYTENDFFFDGEITELFDEQIGITRSTQDEFTAEIVSNLGGGISVYTLKGYDSDCVIGVYRNGWSSVFTCLNGIMVENGRDLFSKMNLAGNVVGIETTSYFDGTLIAVLSDLSSEEFVKELYESTPISCEYGSYDTCRPLQLILRDGGRLRVIVFEDGTLFSGGVRFQLNNEMYQKLWSILAENPDFIRRMESEAMERFDSWTVITKVPEDYTPEQAVADGCYVKVNKEVFHAELLEDFAQRVEAERSWILRVVSYTAEGYPTITDVEYHGKEDGRFLISIDASRDPYGELRLQQGAFQQMEFLEDENGKYLFFSRFNQEFTTDIGKTFEIR